MNINELIKNYLNGLQIGNLEHLLSVFDENAVVVSPLYGTLCAKQFYSDLFKDTNNSKITLLNIFNSSENKNTCAGHFKYEWTMKDDTEVTFECVDVFEITDEIKIKKLTIIYDTYGAVRDSFNKLV